MNHRPPTPAQLAQVGRAADEGSAAKMEFDAAVIAFEAACLRGVGDMMTKRGEEVQAAAQRWMDSTASKYEIMRRITYG